MQLNTAISYVNVSLHCVLKSPNCLIISLELSYLIQMAFSDFFFFSYSKQKQKLFLKIQEKVTKLQCLGQRTQSTCFCRFRTLNLFLTTVHYLYRANKRKLLLSNVSLYTQDKIQQVRNNRCNETTLVIAVSSVLGTAAV